MFFLFYILIGLFAGFLSGLLGIGGGTVLVPGLLFAFSHAGLPVQLQMHLATSTALASIIFSSLVAVIQQQRSYAINWPLFRQLAPGMVIGIVVGALIALFLSTQVLKLLFSLFLFSVAFKILFNRSQPERKETIRLTLLKKCSLGGFIGIISGLLGIGGGAIAVPIFLRLGLSTHHAIATSSACVLLLAIIGALTFTFTGLHAQNLPLGSGGFVYWPAVIGVSIGSMVVVPLGTRLGKRLPGRHLRKIFALFLLVVGITLLIP
ncbi:MAG: sulfite exporter TauE/SafE family protein [Pseudomonadota bacterium]